MYRYRLIVVMIAIISLITFHTAHAQCVAWDCSFGGDHEDICYSVIPRQDGGFALFGHTFSFGSGLYDFYLIRADSLGNLESANTYGSENNERAASMDQTSDGGFILAGSWHPQYSGYWDMYLVKIDSLGNQEWDSTFGFSGNHHDYCASVKQTTEGGYIIAGRTDSTIAGLGYDILVIKLDQTGSVEWQSLYGGERNDICQSIIQTDDGGYFISGSTNSLSTLDDFYAVKTDSIGNIEWETQIGGDEYDRCTDGIQTEDGGYAMAGFSNSFSSSFNDFYVVKLYPDGEIEWERVIGNEYNNQARSVRQTSDQGFIICGNTELTNPGHTQGYIVKLDDSGSKEWQLICGGDDNECLYSIDEVTPSNYISAGITGSYGPSGGYNYWLVKIESEVAISMGSLESICSDGNLLALSPNPTHDLYEVVYSLEQQSRVSITIYSTDGRTMNKHDLGSQGQGVHSVVMNTDDSMWGELPQGLYFVRLDTDDSNSVRKILVLD